MKKVVIFDLDGTLLYTLEDLADSVNYALKTFGYETKTNEEILSYVGNGVRHLMECSVPKGISEEDFESCFACFKDYYSEHCCEKTCPYTDVIPTMKKIKKKGIKIAIVSNKFQAAAEEVCEHYFKGLYDVVIGESEECPRKPAPDGVNKILKMYEVEPDDALYFGDSEVDIETANNAGVFCVSVLWGYRDRELLTEKGARLFIKFVRDIADMLD